MSSNSQLIDQLTRRQILIQRFSGGVIRDLLPIWRQLRDDILTRLSNEPTEFQQARLTLLFQDIDGLIQSATQQMELDLIDNLADFASDEAAFAAKSLQTAVPVEVVLPSIEQTRAVVTRSQMKLVAGKEIKRLTVNQLVAEFDAAQKRAIKGAIQAGVIEGKTVQQMAREVANLSSQRTRRQAEAVVRTAVNHIGSKAREEVYRANSDVLAGEEFVATLDSRTTDTCSGFSDRVFPIGQGPMPPLHYGCRSVRIPAVKDEYKIPGLEGERATVRGPVSANKTFDGWLRDQDADFQKEYFFKFPNGEEKYKLFKYGGMKLNQFTDDSGIAYSLDQLRQLEPVAFGKAGVAESVTA